MWISSKQLKRLAMNPLRFPTYIYTMYIYNCIHIYIYVTAYIYIYAAYIYIFIGVDIRTLEDIPQRTGLLQIHRRFFSQGNSGLFLTRDANPAGLDQPSRSSEWIFNRNVWMCLPSFIWVKLDLAVQFA